MKTQKKAGEVVLTGYLGMAYGAKHIYLKRGLLPRHKYVKLPRDPRFCGRLVRLTIALI
jgi:hypothetical protein